MLLGSIFVLTSWFIILNIVVLEKYLTQVTQKALVSDDDDEILLIHHLKVLIFKV